jgi:CheY-like chemotaxis protein
VALGSGSLVLVVDDNVDVAQTVGWMLEAIGHDHRLVHDGRHALQTAREFRPDVVLLDIGLPGMDGYEVCRHFDRTSYSRAHQSLRRPVGVRTETRNWRPKPDLTIISLSQWPSQISKNSLQVSRLKVWRR